MTTSSEPVVSTLRTQHRSSRYLTRTVGPTAGETLTTPPAALTLLTRQEDHAWRWRGGDGDLHRRRYELPGHARPLILLSFGHGTAAAAHRRAALHHIGRALARLHALSPGVLLGAAPPALRRLHAFLNLSAGTADGWATSRWEAFRRHLRPGLEQELRQDCRRAMTPSAGVLSHGWLGLDKWFDTDRAGVGIIGEDLGTAAPEHDLASVLAQVVEYHRLVPGLVSAAELDGDRSALLAGYQGDVDEAWLDHEIRLAVTRHLGDYALHTRGPDSELERYALLVNGLRTSGRPQAARR